MTKGVFIRTLSGLTPDDDNAREALQGVPVGSLVACEVSRPRNLKHLRLYWKLMASVGDSLGMHREFVSGCVKLKTEHCFVGKNVNGQTMFVPKSIAFPNMNQAEFSAYFNRVCEVLCAEFIPNMKPSELRADVMRMAGIPVESDAM